jgi:carbohydrate-binding DOMON domain-containing protein
MTKTIKPKVSTIEKTRMDQAVEEAIRQTYRLTKLDTMRKYATKAFLWGIGIGACLGLGAAVLVFYGI